MSFTESFLKPDKASEAFVAAAIAAFFIFLSICFYLLADNQNNAPVKNVDTKEKLSEQLPAYYSSHC